MNSHLGLKSHSGPFKMEVCTFKCGHLSSSSSQEFQKMVSQGKELTLELRSSSLHQEISAIEQ